MDRIDDGYCVIADVPGFRRDEMDLRYHNGVLEITLPIEADHGDHPIEIE